MWKVVGLAILMCRVVMASTSEERAYYASERDEEGGPEGIESPSRVRAGELVAPEATRRVNEDENEAASREQSQQQRQSDNASLLDYSRLKSETKRPIVRVNLINDGSSKHRETSAPLASLLYWPDQDQMSGDANERNPRSPGRVNTPFSPWGGKRDLERYKIAKIRRPVRVPFNSWGGKRNGETIESLKRDALLNWEGTKTPPFNSWGGKRASIAARLGYDSGRPPTDTDDSENDDFGSFRHLENTQRLRHPQKFIDDENSMKRISSRLLFRNGEITKYGSSLPGDDSPRGPSWGGYRRGQLRYGDDETHGAGFSLSFRKIGPLVPSTE